MQCACNVFMSRGPYSHHRMSPEPPPTRLTHFHFPLPSSPLSPQRHSMTARLVLARWLHHAEWRVQLLDSRVGRSGAPNSPPPRAPAAIGRYLSIKILPLAGS